MGLWLSFIYHFGKHSFRYTLVHYGLQAHVSSNGHLLGFGDVYEIGI